MSSSPEQAASSWLKVRRTERQHAVRVALQASGVTGILGPVATSQLELIYSWHRPQDRLQAYKVDHRALSGLTCFVREADFALHNDDTLH